jgi:hypothetical protein
MLHDVYEGLLYVGDALAARDLKQLYDQEMAAVVDLAANESPAQLGHDIIYCRFPLSDDESNDDALISLAIKCVHLLMQARVRTLVACSGGMSRSPLIAAAAISMATGDSLANCLVRITANVPHDVSPALFASVSGVHGKLTSA